MRKYLIQCKFCGALLIKTEIVSFFNTEIKCPKCREILKLPEDIIITKEEKKKFQIKKREGA